MPPEHDALQAAKARLAEFLHDRCVAEPRRSWDELLDDEAVLAEFAELWVVLGEALHTHALRKR
jgi:hypothetical protein